MLTGQMYRIQKHPAFLTFLLYCFLFYVFTVGSPWPLSGFDAHFPEASPNYSLRKIKMRLSSPFKDRLQQGRLNLSGYHLPWLSGNSQALLWCSPFPAVIVFQPIKLLCGFALFCWDEIMRGDSFSCLVALKSCAWPRSSGLPVFFKLGSC